MALPILTSLAQLINTSLGEINAFCDAQGVNIPSLNDPFNLESENVRMHPEISEAVSHIVSAAAQIIAIVRPAPLTLFTTAIQVHVSSALRVVVDCHIVELLKDAGPKGLHVNEISDKTGIGAQKLARILRLLCSEHIFQELSPDVFINNRISSALDTGKSYQDIVQRPKDKFIGTNGIAAYVSRASDESVKASGYLYESLTQTSDSNKTISPPSAMSLALRTENRLFGWLSQAGNEDRLVRFGIALEGFDKLLPSNGVSMGYRWDLLPCGSTVVDVGGGFGYESMKLAKAFPGLKLVVQDTSPVVQNGVLTMQKLFPEGLKSKQISFQVHDIFSMQPVNTARIFFLRFILHDWQDGECIKILRNLRAAATPQTELIINECVIQHTCYTSSDEETEKIPGSHPKVHPQPLLANLGHARLFDHLMDIQMEIINHGVERTLHQYKLLLQRSGWRLKEVIVANECSFMLHKLIAIPDDP